MHTDHGWQAGWSTWTWTWLWIVDVDVDADAWEHCQSPNHRNNSPQLHPMAAAMGSQAEITNTRYLIFPKGEPIIRLHAAGWPSVAAALSAPSASWAAPLAMVPFFRVRHDRCLRKRFPGTNRQEQGKRSRENRKRTH